MTTSHSVLDRLTAADQGRLLAVIQMLVESGRGSYFEVMETLRDCRVEDVRAALAPALGDGRATEQNATRLLLLFEDIGRPLAPADGHGYVLALEFITGRKQLRPRAQALLERGLGALLIFAALWTLFAGLGSLLYLVGCVTGSLPLLGMGVVLLFCAYAAIPNVLLITAAFISPVIRLISSSYSGPSFAWLYSDGWVQRFMAVAFFGLPIHALGTIFLHNVEAPLSWGLIWTGVVLVGGGLLVLVFRTPDDFFMLPRLEQVAPWFVGLCGVLAVLTLGPQLLAKMPPPKIYDASTVGKPPTAPKTLPITREQWVSCQNDLGRAQQATLACVEERDQLAAVVASRPLLPQPVTNYVPAYVRSPVCTPQDIVSTREYRRLAADFTRRLSARNVAESACEKRSDWRQDDCVLDIIRAYDKHQPALMNCMTGSGGTLRYEEQRLSGNVQRAMELIKLPHRAGWLYCDLRVPFDPSTLVVDD